MREHGSQAELLVRQVVGCLACIGCQWLALAGIGFMVETALQSGQRWMMIMWKHVVHENDDAYEK